MRALLLLALLAVTADAKSIRKRAIAEFSNPGVPPSIAISDNEEQINSYKSMLEMLLRQLSAIEQRSAPSGLPTSAELDEYARDYYTQAASEIVQKLIEYGALSAIVDAENAAFYDDVDSVESEPSKPDIELPIVRVGVNVDKVAPSSIDEDFTDEQAHEVLKMIVEELMDKFFADMKNTRVYVLGAESKQQEDEDEEADPTSESEAEESDSSSSSEEDDEYYYSDEDEDGSIVIEADDDAVIVVNKQVSTNLIRIPTATFVEALTKLLPSLKSGYPPQLQKLTPLQVEDPRVYAEHPELIGTETVHPTRVSSHSVRPIASVAPTAAAATESTSSKSEKYHLSFDLGHILLCLAAILLCIWAIAQLYSMYRNRGQHAAVAAPAPAMALPPKVIPSIIPNIYATPPPVLSKQQADPEKPPVYVENPSFTKPEV